MPILQHIFGADAILMENITSLDKDAPNIILYALPAILIITLLEYALSRYSEHAHYEKRETFGSVLIGLGNLGVNLLMKMALLYGAVWIYNLLPWRMELNWWLLIPCFLIYDCCSYWSHRISHFNRFFWATHVVHHSAEHYNLTVAFRQSWVQHFKTVFFIPVALMGFHPVIFFVASQLSTLYQFWVHTESIGKLHPVIERYFCTPSNHRVHHGSQDKYLDKNFGAVLMIWDHWFGTFQYEEEQPIYGLTKPLEHKINPLVLNFHEFKDMVDDVRQSRDWKESLFFIFSSPAKIHGYKKREAVKRMNLRLSTKRWPAARRSSVFLVMLLSLCQISPAQSADEPLLPTPRKENMLFFLQRDPDANTVVYELNYLSEGQLDPRRPVRGSWIRYAEDGKCRELSVLENRYAYGVRCKSLGGGEYELRLAAYKKLPLYLKRSENDQKYRIYIRDEGKDYLLKRVFVRVRGGSFWFPNVKYIDLITVNSESGAEFLKRINI